MKVITVCMLLLYLCLGALAAYFGFSAKHTSGTRVSGLIFGNSILKILDFVGSGFHTDLQ